MKLYHYAVKRYGSLLASRHALKNAPDKIAELEAKDKQLGRKFGYLDHVSFFFDPLPIDIGSLYEGVGHPLWKKGQVLYQHEVETLGMEFAFELYETPQLDALMQSDWTTDMSESDKKAYFKKEFELLVRNGHYADMGRSTTALIGAVSPFLGKTREAYVKSLITNDKAVLARHYAPSVPHLMLYPKHYEIPLLGTPKRIILS